MMKIKKGYNSIVLILLTTFLCQTIAFGDSTLRPPSHFTKDTEEFIVRQYHGLKPHVYEIGIEPGKEVVCEGQMNVIGETSQIKIQGKTGDTGQIVIGNNLSISDGFISFRTTQGNSAVGINDTTTVSKMEIGDDVVLSDGAELLNVPKTGNGVVIVGAPVAEFGEGEGIGDGARIIGNSDIKMSSVGKNAIIDEQSKVFKAVVGEEANIINASVIGGHDELVDGWRRMDEEGNGRGVVLEKKAIFKNGLAYHGGASDGEAIKPIIVREGVELNGVFLLCENNIGIDIQTSLLLPIDKRVYIHDGVVLDEVLKHKIQQLLAESNIVLVTYEDGQSNARAMQGNVETFDLKDVLALKKEYSIEWVKEIPRVFFIQTVYQAQYLNEVLKTQGIFVDRQQNIWIQKSDGYHKVNLKIGAISEEIEKPAEIVVIIKQGCFVYPGLEVYAKKDRVVAINLLEIGSRGGTKIVADRRDVHLGPEDRSAGRIAAAVIRDVDVNSEFNCFGGIADNITGNAKLTIRNQGILRDAILRRVGEGTGEIIWGWYQGQGVEIEVGDENIGLTHHGLIYGKPLAGSEGYSIRIGPHFQGGYWCSVVDKRINPMAAHIIDHPLQDGVREDITPLKNIRQQQICL